MNWPWGKTRQATSTSNRSPQARISARYDAVGKELAILDRELPTRDHRDDNLAASGVLIRHGGASYLRRLIMPWQIRAFGYYDLLGEIKYSAQFYSRALANLEIYAAEKDENGDIVPTEDEEVIAAVERIKDPGGGGRSGLLADYGRLMFLVGEALLFVSRSPHTDLEQWEMLSTDELRVMDGTITRFMAPTMPAMNFKPAPDDAFVPVDDDTAAAYRLHRRHPRYSSLADSTLEGALDICEELVLLTQVVRARARSRMATAGLLFLDGRITTRPDEPVPDEDVQEDPFLADLTEALTSPITDEGTASAVVPLVARIEVPEGMKMSDLVYHLQIVDPLQIYPETGLRMECIRRLAIVLDMPPEVLLGVATVNHWGAWMVDEQSWKVHLQPIAKGLVEDLTSAYLQPYLRETNKDGWDNFFIAYDATNVINHPDRTKDALELHDRAVVGDAALREAAGFDEDDAPTDEELARIVGMATRDSSLAWYGEPSPRGGSVEPEAGVVVDSSSNSKPGSSTGASTEKGPPPGGPEGGEPEGYNTIRDVFVAAQVTGVAQLALLRSREAAGSRLRTLARRTETIDEINGCPNGDVAAHLGRARVRVLLNGQGEGDLIGASRDLILATLSVIGIEDETVARLIAETIEKHAIRTLYDRSIASMPDTFTGYVTGLLAAPR